MEHRIELERRGREKEKVTELNLDNCRSTNVIGLEDFKNLRILSLINVGLTTLKGFPALPELRKLELSDNRISSGVDNLLKCPKLTHLSLSGNKIKDFEALDQLKDLKELKSLDLFNCEVTSEKDYRQKLFGLIPSLEFLDGTDKDDQEIEDEDEEEVDGEDDDDEEDDLDVEDDEFGDELDDEDDDDDVEEDDEDGVEVDGNVDVAVVGENDDDDDDDDDDDGELGEEGDDDDDDEEDDDEDEEEYEDNAPGLDMLQKENLSEEEDEGEFEPEADDDDDDLNEDDDDDDDEDDDDADARGQKRKREGEEDD